MLNITGDSIMNTTLPLGTLHLLFISLICIIMLYYLSLPLNPPVRVSSHCLPLFLLLQISRYKSQFWRTQKYFSFPRRFGKKARKCFCFRKFDSNNISNIVWMDHLSHSLISSFFLLYSIWILIYSPWKFVWLKWYSMIANITKVDTTVSLQHTTLVTLAYHGWNMMPIVQSTAILATK